MSPQQRLTVANQPQYTGVRNLPSTSHSIESPRIIQHPRMVQGQPVVERTETPTEVEVPAQVNDDQKQTESAEESKSEKVMEALHDPSNSSNSQLDCSNSSEEPTKLILDKQQQKMNMLLTSTGSGPSTQPIEKPKQLKQKVGLCDHVKKFANSLIFNSIERVVTAST